MPYTSLRDTLADELSKFQNPDCSGHSLHVYQLAHALYKGKRRRFPCIDKSDVLAIAEIVFDITQRKTHRSVEHVFEELTSSPGYV